jgi:hypothetical protein
LCFLHMKCIHFPSLEIHSLSLSSHAMH